jgi:hypothetical protein
MQLLLCAVSTLAVTREYVVAILTKDDYDSHSYAGSMFVCFSATILPREHFSCCCAARDVRNTFIKLYHTHVEKRFIPCINVYSAELVTSVYYSA